MVNMQWRADSSPKYMDHYELSYFKVLSLVIHWYNVFNLRNENVMDLRLIVNMPFKWHYVEGHADIGAKLSILYLDS